jgi:hypothetical protein
MGKYPSGEVCLTELAAVIMGTGQETREISRRRRHQKHNPRYGTNAYAPSDSIHGYAIDSHRICLCLLHEFVL